MAEVGELTWVAEIQGLASAKRDAESVSDGVGDLAEDAKAADGAVGGIGGTAKSAGGSLAGMGSASGLLRGALGLLNGQVVQLILSVTGLSAVIAKGVALFGAIGSGVSTLIGLTGGLTAIWGVLVTAGQAVIGIVAAIAAILGLPVWATAALIAALIAVVAAIWVFRDEIGAAIGKVIDFFAQLLSDGVGYVVNLASRIRNTTVSLASDLIAWARGVSRDVAGFIGGLASNVVNSFTGMASDAYSAVTDFTSNVKGSVSDMAKDAYDSVTGFASDVRSSVSGLVSDVIGFGSDLSSGFTDAITDGVTGVWNTVIPSSVGFPEVSLPSTTIDAGPLGSTTVGGQTVFSGFNFDLPQLETGGFVESGGAVEVHDDEMVLPADVSRDVMNAIGGGSGGDTGGERAVVRIQQLMIDIGDQTLDIRELGRFELEQLAELIGEQMGDELQRLV